MRAGEGDVRPPAVAGTFYPAGAEELRGEVARFLTGAGPGRRVLGLVAPHAGYVYSGATAGRGFAAVEIPARVVILCPNHTGRGPRIAIAPQAAFRVPTGDVAIDATLAAAILEAAVRRRLDAALDGQAHAREHAIEVMLPFLQARRPDVQVVPIVVGGLREPEAIAFGEALAEALSASPDTLILASSDLNHYLDDAETRRRDRLAIDALLGGDPATLYRTVHDHDISMCGVLPATALLSYARARRGELAHPELLAYATSADAHGDTSRCVGYASVVVP
jgi:AmmeMemoRadiSam system protein B